MNWVARGRSVEPGNLVPSTGNEKQMVADPGWAARLESWTGLRLALCWVVRSAVGPEYQTGQPSVEEPGFAWERGSEEPGFGSGVGTEKQWG